MNAHQRDMAKAKASYEAAEEAMGYWSDFDKKMRNPTTREPAPPSVQHEDYEHEELTPPRSNRLAEMRADTNSGYWDYEGGDDPIDIANDWHGGQNSPMYSFASTRGHSGANRDLLREIESNINHPDTHPREVARLESLHEYVRNDMMT